MPRAGEAITLGSWDVLRPQVDGVWRSTVSGIPGWWTKPSVRSDDTPLIADDGEAVTENRTYGARIISLEGDVSCRSREAMLAFRDRLAGVLAGGPVRFQVEGHGQLQWATVVETGEMGWTEKSPVAASWQLPMKAPDPRKYGITRRFPETGTSPAGTSVDVWHEGNYPAAPKITSQGYMPEGYTAFGTGSDRFRVTEGVNTGETLVADFKVGHVYLNGVRKPTAGGYRSLARIPAGRTRATNVIPARPDLASNARFYVEVTDTWI